MKQLHAIAIRIVALAFAVLSGWFLFAFGRAVDPQPSMLREAVSAAIFGILAHVGLFLSADVASRSLWYRRLAFVLMLPSSAVLGASSLGAARRLFGDSPMPTAVILVYFVGFTIYILLLSVIIRAGLTRSNRATAA